MVLRKVLAAALVAGGAAGAQANEPVVFDPATGRLSMGVLQLDAGVRYRDVVIQLLHPGQLQVNDPSVGPGIQFMTTGNVLRLPQVVIAGVTYPRVSLTKPGLVLLSVGELVVDSNAGGAYQLDIQVLAAGVSIPPITVSQVPKPANQAQFCSDPSLRETIVQNTGGLTGSWQMTGCSFDGTSGRIDMVLNAGFLTLPYSATYSYR